MRNSFSARGTLRVGDREYEVFRLAPLSGRFDVARLPYSLKVLLENLLRHEDGVNVSANDIEALAGWCANGGAAREISFTPSRVLLQDFTGVPAVVDLAAMRDAMHAMGGDPSHINPLQAAELVIDHSVQVDAFGTDKAFRLNAELEFQRNRERYAFLRWGQKALSNFQVVPPDTGIVHQVNLEYLARVVFVREDAVMPQAYPDTLVGTDSHTTMINGLGVLGWGVGGIEAEAAMLGQPVSMLIPDVVGFHVTGKLPEGATATDLVLTVTQMLRAKGVVGKFVEFHGDGLDHLPLADRATIANMAPEYGATCGIFPVDQETLRYLRISGRSAEQVALVEAYARDQGLFRESGMAAPCYSDGLELDLSAVEPSIAGPKRPQDRIAVHAAKQAFQKELGGLVAERRARADADAEAARFEGEGGHTAVGIEDPRTRGMVPVNLQGATHELHDGSVVIAAITSCTNTSNPAVMIGAGLLAKKARARGLDTQPWVKTSLAPGSRVVTDYLNKAGLQTHLEALGFHLVGYGCTTCIGNSGPLPEPVSAAIRAGDLVVCSVLSGNRNFEGRIHSEVRMNYLASPPLVVAYALAGRMDIDLLNEPLGLDPAGAPVYLRDVWPSQREIHETIEQTVRTGMFQAAYRDVFAGDRHWNGLTVPEGERFAWDDHSTYIKQPPYFVGMSPQPAPLADIHGARVLALLGNSVTTDHISPAGAIEVDSAAGQYLIQNGVQPVDFNSYGSRRGNHEVMMRGTFANIRLRNRLAPDTEGSWTVYVPEGTPMWIFDAAMRYRDNGVPLLVVAGKEYGSGSSRDWAAKGPRLLGVCAVLAESYERIHRSNLVGMGVLPLQFRDDENAEILGLTGLEEYAISGLSEGSPGTVTVTAAPADGPPIRIQARVRIDTPQEWEYYRHGGILAYVLRQLLARDAA
ncbi:MAG: aconitate hydratase 1 [Chromatiales bacterium 21-64-14]|nr:MAG: aconitate hydratase 1 [Chromatiales bacterium 21-64-14]HQU16404.1 aconitate hydratase AcnA [Gammaproteobacteria bacterium]